MPEQNVPVPIDPEVLAKLLEGLAEQLAALQGMLASNAAYVAGAKAAPPLVTRKR
jgi:hypothetical protein